MNTNDKILFYNRGKPFYELTNFWQGNPISTGLPEITADGQVKDNPSSEIKS